MGWDYLPIHKLQRYNRWSLGMDKWFHPTPYSTCNYLSMLGLQLIHVNKKAPGVSEWLSLTAYFSDSRQWDPCNPYKSCNHALYVGFIFPHIGCHQETSHYLRQCWARSISPYGITMPIMCEWNVCIIMLSNVWYSLYYNSELFYAAYIPIYLRVASQALEQS